MARHKTHYEIIESEPNESDTEGSSFLACGRDSAVKFSTDLARVDCKECLAANKRADAADTEKNKTGAAPTLKAIQDWAWRKADRQDVAVNVAQAMKWFKVDQETIMRLVGFVHAEDCEPYARQSDYFFIETGAPDLPPEKLEFGFDGE